MKVYIKDLLGSLVFLTVIILIISVVALNEATARECQANEELSQQQMFVLGQAYSLGSQHDLSYSLAAIAWKESLAGKVIVNAQEASYGPFQILLKTAVTRTQRDGRTLSNFEQNILATKLLDIKFSSSYAIQELEYWHGIHGGNWRAIYASYNGGWSHSKAVPQAYAQDIVNKIQKLKGCFEEYHLCPHCGG